MKVVILCDFDGTISVTDMGYLLLNRFSRGDWEAIDQAFCAGKIGSREAYSRIAGIVRGKEEDILRFIQDHSEIDPHFVSFYRHCKARGIDVKIVSDGLDFYIRTLLALHNLSEIPYYANDALCLGDEGLHISFPFFNEECGLCGTCKKRLVQIHREQYETVLFAGNGLSDRCGAREADFVFAKDSLYAHCVAQDIPCRFFESFGEVLQDLEKKVRGVIFDLDGTLIEANEAIYLGMKDAFEHFGREIFPTEDLPKHLGVDLQGTLRPFFSPEEIREAIPIMRKKYEEVYREKTHFLEGARETLEALHHRGILMGVASNKLGRFSRGALDHLEVAEYFKSITGAGDVPRNKPYPDMIRAVLREMDLAAEEVVFVGDTLADIETGKNAGVDVYALTTGVHSRADLAVGKPKQILRSLKELLQAVMPLLPPHHPVS
ncbi:MAG: HAD family hydrolase [Deltaproteobacteria bacterium]|nr:MAG: HAD family hydrolase [Deltaproteobacteria bacterium]